MAILRNEALRRRVMLRPIHTFGRHPASCRTVLQEADVSKLHALIRWSGSQWEIYDQSRNGTLLDGKKLSAGQWQVLQQGQQIQFGAGPHAIWEVIDDAAPQVCLFALDEPCQIQPLRPEENLLPDVRAPEVNIYHSNATWLLDRMNRMDALADGDCIRIGPQLWEFVLGEELDMTQEAPAQGKEEVAEDLHFDFHLSQNEEHTSLDLRVGQQVISLGERIHHYTLATLARQRLRDARQGVEESSQGWIPLDNLARMLGVDPPYINIQIFRARQQITRALPMSRQPASLFERRRGEVRFGGYPFRILKGLTEEGRFPHAAMM